MELVKGILITEYCDEHHLTTRQRLKLFISVCQAVQHAHHKGIIHRDLKPSNVLVARYDDQPVPKIIDFGVAKALNQSLTDKTMFTQFGQIVGTLEYMSPEQSQFNQLDVDTRSDVYSLGVLLYELLTGTTPFDRERLRSSGLDEILRIIGEEEPPRPSTRLAMSQTLPAVAAGRACDARRLPGLIRGDLDWIVMKAISKDRSDRYETASALADDVRRHLEDQPILARRPSIVGRMRRFTRRNRVAVSLGLMAAVAMLATLVMGVLRVIERADRAAEALAERIEQEEQERADDARATLPEARRLMGADRIVAAFQIARTARRDLPEDDHVLKPSWEELTSPLTLETDPPGATVWIRDWNDPNGEWVELGETPLEKADLPAGWARWRFELDGYVSREMVRNLSHRDHYSIDMYEPVDDGMVAIHGQGGEDPGIVPTGDFLIDRYEVTNARFQEFVDAGGYAKPELWRHEFVKDGEVVSREAAMEHFIDESGQPGPRFWSHGRYPPGEHDYPVRGVSWYEAAAYAEYRGMHLPTVHHWWAAVNWDRYSQYIVPFSNFSGEGPAPVGRNEGIGRFDVYDLAGNVAEWCFNEEQPGIRCLRGGAWDDPSYMFTAMDHGHAMDREAGYGFRCAAFPHGNLPSAEALQPFNRRFRSFEEPPESDAVMEFIFGRFNYDDVPLDWQTERNRDRADDDCFHETVSIRAAYEDERFDIHLYTPVVASPPYQTVVWVPGSGAFQSESFKARKDPLEIRFQEELLATGRAVCLPVCKGMFERGNGRFLESRERFLQLVQDVRRTVDYLATRRGEFDNDRLIYGGFSYGARIGPIVTAVEPRFAASILINGGYAVGGAPAEMDPYNFNHRVRVPVLMINGRFDALFPVEAAQQPFFDHLGTPVEHKKLIHFDGGHSLPSREAVEAMDRWLQQELPRR